MYQDYVRRAAEKLGMKEDKALFIIRFFFKQLAENIKNPQSSKGMRLRSMFLIKINQYRVNKYMEIYDTLSPVWRKYYLTLKKYYLKLVKDGKYSQRKTKNEKDNERHDSSEG